MLISDDIQLLSIMKLLCFLRWRDFAAGKVILSVFLMENEEGF